MIEDINEKCEETCSGSLTKTVKHIKESIKNEDDFLSIAEVFKALGDPTRVKIIYSLSQGELCVHDLTEVLDMSQSAISHQLRYLRNLRVVKRRKEGKTVFYSLDDHHIEQTFTQTFNHIKHR